MRVFFTNVLISFFSAHRCRICLEQYNSSVFCHHFRSNYAIPIKITYALHACSKVNSFMHFYSIYSFFLLYSLLLLFVPSSRHLSLSLSLATSPLILNPSFFLSSAFIQLHFALFLCLYSRSLAFSLLFNE